MKPVVTGIIGCGPRGRGHVQAARDGGALDVKYACDIRSDRLEEAVREWGVEGVTDYRAVLDDPEVEAVNIVTDVANHLHIARDALAAGKHIICEKPFGDDIGAARELVAAAEAGDRVAYISFQLRFAAQYAAMRDGADVIDPVQMFMGRSRGMMKDKFLTPSPFHGIMDVCAHDLDIISWLMATAPEAVTAVVRRDTFMQGTGAADTISALIDFGEGRCATMVSSIGAPELGSKCDLTGACGNVTFRGGETPTGIRFSRFETAGPKQKLDFSAVQKGNPDQNLQVAFQREIRTGERSRAARLRDGLNSLLLTMACLKSMQEKRRVAMDEIT